MTQADLFAEPPEHRRTRARRLRDAGMQTAVDHADAVAHEWSESAYAKLRAYIAPLDHGAAFTCEQVRDYAERSGLSSPPDNRAWGHVMRRGLVAGLYRKRGYVEATDPRVHCNVVTQWAKP